MNWCLKLILGSIILAGNFAVAGALDQKTSDLWNKRLSESCDRSTAKSRKDLSEAQRKAFCACVARNHVEVANDEESGSEAVAQLAYLEKLYSETNERVIKEDPFAILDWDIAIAKGCLRRPDFKFDPGN